MVKYGKNARIEKMLDKLDKKDLHTIVSENGLLVRTYSESLELLEKAANLADTKIRGHEKVCLQVDEDNI